MATSTRPRYLVQIPDRGDWKTVAHFDDDDEARRTTALPNVRVLDTFTNAVVPWREDRRRGGRPAFGRSISTRQNDG